MSESALDEARKLIELVEKVREIFGGKFLLSTCINIAVISFSVLLLSQISFISDMMRDMSETIKSLSFLAFLLCVVSIPTVMFTNRIFRKCDELQAKKKQEEAKKAAEREEAERKAAILREVAELGKSEKAILDYTLDIGEGCAWLPAGDKAVLMLYSRGILDMLYHGDALIRNGEQCFVFKVAERIAHVMKETRTEIPDWEEGSMKALKFKLNQYQ